MRRICLLICVALLAPGNIGIAQFLRGFGVVGGAISSNQSWNYSLPGLSVVDGNRWGVDVGVFVEGLDLRWLSVTGEAHYIQQGFTSRVAVTSTAYPEGTGQYAVFEPRADYLSLPLLAKARLFPEGWTPYLLAGPRIDILLGTAPDGFNAVLDRFSGADIGVAVGGGVEFPVPAGQTLLVQVLYGTSFNKAFENDYLAVRNHAFSFLAGVRF